MEYSNIKRLRLKIIVVTLSFSLIPLFSLGLTLYSQFRAAYTTQVTESLRALTENRRDAIDLFLDERISQLTTLAYAYSFNDLNRENILNEIFTRIQSRAKSYIDIGIIDQYGNHAAYLGPYALKGINYRNEEWFQEVMLRGVYVSDVFTGFRNFPHFIIAVMRREETAHWILRVTIDTDIFEEMVKAAQKGKRGDAYILNKTNIFQTKPRVKGNLLEKSNLPSFSRFAGTRIDEMTVGDEKGLYAKAWLRNKEWLLVIKEDPREEFIPLLRVWYWGIGLACAGILVIILGAVFVSHQIIAQWIQGEREKAVLDSSLIQSSKMAALGKMAAGIAHEVNNPLAVIREKAGWIKDLLAEEDFPSNRYRGEIEDAMNKIETHVDRAKKITQRLLGFARRMEPTKDFINVNTILEETITFLENEALFRNIRIEKKLVSELPQTMSDAAQIQQVFLNILNNAIDAIGKNGEILISTFFNSKENGDIAISFMDNGPGIPKNVISRIFDPFFTTKAPGDGTGLGLAISYSIIEKLGGRIMVASEEGQGTTFTIYLPVIKRPKE